MHLKKEIKIGEFLCSHFNTEDGRKKGTFSGSYALLFQERSKPTKTHKKICAVYGEGAVTDRTCQKWFAKFCAGDLSLDDAPRSGRPAEVDSDQIKTIIENNECYTTLEIADILKIYKSSIENKAPAWLCELL